MADREIKVNGLWIHIKAHNVCQANTLSKSEEKKEVIF